MPITGLNVLNTFHHTSKADRWIEAKTATPKTAATKTSTPKTAAPKAKPSGTTQAAKSSGAKSPTVKELREQAKAKGIKGYSSMTKAELLNAVGGA